MTLPGHQWGGARICRNTIEQTCRYTIEKLAKTQLNKLAEIQLNNHNCELDRWYKTKHSTNESISRFNEILNFDISAIEHLTSYYFFGITSNSILLKNALLEVWCLVGMICDTSWCPQVLVACQTLFKVDSVDSKCHISCRRQLQKQTEEVWRVCNLQWQISRGQHYVQCVEGWQSGRKTVVCVTL